MHSHYQFSCQKQSWKMKKRCFKCLKASVKASESNQDNQQLRSKASKEKRGRPHWTHWWLVFPSEVLVIWTIIPKHKVVDWGLEGFHQVREGRPKRPKYDREEGKTKRIAQNEAVICPWAMCQFLSPSQAETWKNQAKNTAEPLELEAKMSAVHQCYRDRSRNSRPPKISRDEGGQVELAHILAVQLIYNNEESYILKFPINLKYPL